MTTQQENYIESRIEAYREELELKAEDWIRGEVETAMSDQEQAEAERATVDLHLHGLSYEAHMKKFLEDTEKETYNYFKDISDKEICKKLDEYRRELESEVE